MDADRSSNPRSHEGRLSVKSCDQINSYSLLIDQRHTLLSDQEPPVEFICGALTTKADPLRPKLLHDLEIRGITAWNGVETTYEQFEKPVLSSPHAA